MAVTAASLPPASRRRQSWIPQPVLLLLRFRQDRRATRASGDRPEPPASAVRRATRVQVRAAKQGRAVSRGGGDGTLHDVSNGKTFR